MLQLRQQLKAQGEDASASRKVQLILEDGSVHPQPATLQFAGVTVDRGTGAVTLRATVPNPQGTLLPGMVVRARVVAGVQANAILVPQQGVSRSPRGDATALVVVEGGKVERRTLVVTRAVGNQWLVASGLQPGDRLIVEGLQRARPGQTVTAVPAGTSGKAKATPPAASGASGKPAAASAPAR
jgi:membrane fusion protein (multidrug efflux system)